MGAGKYQSTPISYFTHHSTLRNAKWALVNIFRPKMGKWVVFLDVAYSIIKRYEYRRVFEALMSRCF